MPLQVKKDEEQWTTPTSTQETSQSNASSAVSKSVGTVNKGDKTSSYGAANAGVNRSFAGSATAGSRNKGGTGNGLAATTTKKETKDRTSGYHPDTWVETSVEGTDPYEWGNTVASTKQGVDEEFQQKLDNFEIAYNDPNRDFHFYIPQESDSDELKDAINAFNQDRSLYMYDQYWQLKNSRYSDDAEWQKQVNQWIQDAQIYGKWAEDNGFVVTLADGTEVNAADLWKDVWFDAKFERDFGFYYDSDESQRNLSTTSYKLGEAQKRLDAAETDQEKEFWSNVVDAYFNLRSDDNRSEVEKLKTQKDANEQERLQLKNDTRSASDIVTYWDIANEYDDTYYSAAASLAEAEKRSNELSAGDADIDAQIAKLDSDYRDWNMTEDVAAAIGRLSNVSNMNSLVKIYKELGARNQREAEAMYAEDQKLADAFENNYGAGAHPYTTGARLSSIVGSFAERNSEVVLNLLAIVGQAADYGAGLANVDQDALLQQAYATDPTMLTPEITKATDDYAAQFNENGGNDSKIAKAVDAIEAAADDLGVSAQEDLQRAKNGLSDLGQFGVDLVSTGLDVGFDAITGGGLYTMFARVLGNSIGEARRSGATAGEQFLYGLSQASIEMFTEKISDGLGAVYGSSLGGDIVDTAIKKLASSDLGASFLKVLAGVIGEGGEEVVSDLLNPFTQWIIDENKRDNRTYSVDVSELLYDFLLGGAMGLFGSVAESKGTVQDLRLSDLETVAKAEIEQGPLTKSGQAELDQALRRDETRGVKGAVFVDGKGRAIVNDGSKRSRLETVKDTKSGNRMSRITDQMVEGIDATGMAKDVDEDEAYDRATSGMEERAPSADSNGPEISDEEAPPEAPTAEKEEAQRQAEEEREEELNREGLEKEEESYQQSFEEEAADQELSEPNKKTRDIVRRTQQMLGDVEAGDKTQGKSKESESEAAPAEEQEEEQAPEVTDDNSAESGKNASESEENSAPTEIEEETAESQEATEETVKPEEAEESESAVSEEAEEETVSTESSETRAAETAEAEAAETGITETAQAETVATEAQQAEIGEQVDRAVRNNGTTTFKGTNTDPNATVTYNPVTNKVEVRNESGQVVESTKVSSVQEAKIKIAEFKFSVPKASTATAQNANTVLRSRRESGNINTTQEGSDKGGGSRADTAGSEGKGSVEERSAGNDGRGASELVENQGRKKISELTKRELSTARRIIKEHVLSASTETGTDLRAAFNSDEDLYDFLYNAYSYGNVPFEQWETYYPGIDALAEKLDKALADEAQGKKGKADAKSHEREARALIQNATKDNPLEFVTLGPSGQEVIWHVEDGKNWYLHKPDSVWDANESTVAQLSNALAKNRVTKRPEMEGGNTDAAQSGIHQDIAEESSGQDTGRGDPIAEYVESLDTPEFHGNEREIRRKQNIWKRTVYDILTQGATLVETDSLPESVKKAIRWAEKAGVEHVTVFYATDTADLKYCGLTFGSDPSIGCFAVITDGSSAVKTIAHEAVHNLLARHSYSVDLRAVLERAFKETGFDPSFLDNAYQRVKRIYAPIYHSEIFGDEKSWRALTIDEQDQRIYDAEINNPDFAERFNDEVSEELVCDLASNCNDWFEFENVPYDTTGLSINVQGQLEDIGVFEASALNDFQGISDEFDEELPGWVYNPQVSAVQAQQQTDELAQLQTKNEALQAENESLRQQIAELQNPQDKTQTGRTPGKMGQKSQSAIESALGTKGENTFIEETKELGSGTYTSRTNADRSRTADLKTDTQEKTDAETKRLTETDPKEWTDDDVVIAQKLLGDMIKNIRDYQLNRTHKMKPEAFQTMTSQYNKLLQAHKEALSKAGQTLQANYEFSVGDQIIMRAAQTFLGFTEDGRFAGGHPGAKNAKIYGAIENMVDKVESAVEANNAADVAQICKNVSTIRNVKKMFGPLADFVEGVETRVLNRIATEENGLKTLETLAYGNLNAMCDDVQPYKHVNAAKTIRVMNMLSNMATIVNNVGNNWMQGLTSSNALSQAMTQIASKPFQNLTGQSVVSKSKRGWVANKEIRNAEYEALEQASLMQMYGMSVNNGRLELNDKGMFNPNANGFEQAMALYKFLVGMGVEATDQVKAAGLRKSMEMGVDEDIESGKASKESKEQRMKEIEHEVNRLLYKDDNKLTSLVQHARDSLNSLKTWGNEKTGTIGLGDITMTFAKIPANVVKARLGMTPVGALYNLSSYTKGVIKAKNMHAEYAARTIAEDSNLSDAQKWAKARQECSGKVYNNLVNIRNNYAQNISFDHAVQRAGYDTATEMSQFEMAQLSRKVGRAATSAAMMVLGSALRGIGAIKDFDQEPNDELRKMYSEKGYTGLMFNFSAIGRKDHSWHDGDVIIDGDWLEVLAMPLAIGATAAESSQNSEGSAFWNYTKEASIGGLLDAITAVGDIPGMTDAINLFNSINSSYNTDTAAKGQKLANSLVLYGANTLPSFFMPNAVTQFAAGLDNTVRNTYASDNIWQQAGYTIANKIPGLRSKVPASVDVWGNERTYGENKLMGIINKSLLPGDVRIFHQNKYEQEIERLVNEGYKGATPKTTVNSSFEVNGETYKMTADEVLDYRTERNHEQSIMFESFMDSEWYDQLDDGQREAVLKSLKTSADRDARQDWLNDHDYSVNVNRDSWESLPTLDEQIQYLSSKQLLGKYWDSGESSITDYAGMDKVLVSGVFNGLSKEQKKLLDNSLPYADQMMDAKGHGIDSAHWQIMHNIYRKYNAEDEDGKSIYAANLENEAAMWSDIQKATGYADNSEQMQWARENLELHFTGTPNAENYDELINDYGFSRESAAAVTKDTSNIGYRDGYTSVQNADKWNAIAADTSLTDAEKWDSYFALVPKNSTKQIAQMQGLRGKMNPRTLKPYTFSEAINTVKDSRGNPISTTYRKEIQANGKEKYIVDTSPRKSGK